MINKGDIATVTVGSFATELKARYIEKSRTEPGWYWFENTKETDNYANYKKGERLCVARNNIGKLVCDAPNSFLPCNVRDNDKCLLPTSCDYQRK